MPSHKDFNKTVCSACSLELQHACISLQKCQQKEMLKLSAKYWISGSTEQFSFQLLLHRELIRAEELEQSKPHSFWEGGWLSPWSSVPSWHDTQAAQGKLEEFAHCSLLCFEWKHSAQLHPSDLAKWLGVGGDHSSSPTVSVDQQW